MIFENNINVKAITELAKNYNVLDYNVQLAKSLNSIFPAEDFDQWPKYELHKLLSETVFQNYNGEEIHKYNLFQYQINKPNIIGAFEIKVNNSRVDFLTINGHTTSYEIKSELDNLSKLKKQMADYMLAFEYNYLVIDERHIKNVESLLPETYGLWSYKNGKYKKLKKAILNTKVNAEVQLKLLTKKEVLIGFPQHEGNITDILKFNDINSINKQFKKSLKDRYRNRWNFLLTNYTEIFPIDVQFFFNTNIPPRHIYHL